MLIAGWVPGYRFTFYTDNYSMHVRGVLWFGDLDTRHVDAYLGSSVITTEGGFDAIAQSNVYFENATINANAPPGGYTGQIQAYAHEWGGQVYGGTATVNVNGNFRLNAYGAVLRPQAIYTQSSKWTITGYVAVNDVDHFIDFGQSMWTIGGAWTSISTSSSWNAGTATVIFNSSSSVSLAFANLGEQEFNIARFLGTATVTSTLLSAATIRIETGATLTMGTSNFSGFGALENYGTLSMDGITVSRYPLVIRVGGGDSITITQWTAWTVTAGVLTDIRWTFSSTTSASTGVTIQIDNLSLNYRYVLSRAGAEVDSDRDGDTSAELSLGLGWTSGPWAMAITASLMTVESPLPQDTTYVVRVVILVLFSALMFAGTSKIKDARKRWAIRVMVILVAAWFLF